MTRNLCALVSHTLRTDRNRTARARRRNAGLSLENLEVRLALSSVPAAPVPLDLNPQPLPPGVVRKLNLVADGIGILNCPEFLQEGDDGVGNHVGTKLTPSCVGQHYGQVIVVPAIVGNHIGTSVAPDTGGQYYARQN